MFNLKCTLILLSLIKCVLCNNNYLSEDTESSFNKSLLIGKNVTKILDNLLKGYDKLLRPNYSGKFKSRLFCVSNNHLKGLNKGPPVSVGITSNFIF